MAELKYSVEGQKGSNCGTSYANIYTKFVRNGGLIAIR